MPFLTRLHGIAGPGAHVWTISQPMLYLDPDSRIVYMCLPGQVSDLASIPRIARALIPGTGHERQPAVLHDRVYDALGAITIVENPAVLPMVHDKYNPWEDADSVLSWHWTHTEREIYELWNADLIVAYNGNLTRQQADALFNRAMQCAGVSWLERQLMYRAVQLGGWVPWRNNEATAGV